MFMQVMGESLGKSVRLLASSAFSGVQSTSAPHLVWPSQQCSHTLGVLAHFTDGEVRLQEAECLSWGHSWFTARSSGSC